MELGRADVGSPHLWAGVCMAGMPYLAPAVQVRALGRERLCKAEQRAKKSHEEEVRINHYVISV